jgi:predicted nucleotidyltransferase
MKYNIPNRVLKDLCNFAKENDITKIILFGSRARGTNTERSDIDIAVSGGNFDNFYWQVMEKVHSLLTFDIIELDKGITKELQKELDNEGIIIYEKI